MRNVLRGILVGLLLAGLAVAWSTAPATTIDRGPYLQDQRAGEVTLVFRTADATSVSVRYGPYPGAPWPGRVDGAADTTHVLRLTGLSPGTAYAYEVLDGSQAVLAAGDELVFRTPPADNSTRAFRFVAFGDSGTGSSEQLAVAARMEEVVPWPELALGLGDLVYPDGAAQDYDPHLFEPYAGLLCRTPFWPTLGNHDAETSNGAPYFEAFHLPTDTGAPGHASGTEHYYSFDHGLAHFTCLDSQLSDKKVGGAMYDWAADDLADARARGKRWLVVFMHHPPYTKGTHDSDSESELIELRESFVPLFDANGVDLVLSGHSHVYERSYLAEGDAALQNDPESYEKITSPDGTVYLVSGCGGKSGNGPLDHPLMATSLGRVTGFSVIDVGPEEIRGSFVDDAGTTLDLFSIRKELDTRAPTLVDARSPDPALTSLDVIFDEPVRAGTGTGGSEAPGAYSLDGGLSVTSAVLDSDRRTVRLGTTTQQAGKSYEVSAPGVQDESGLAAVGSLPFVAFDAAAGGPVARIAVDRPTANAPATLGFSGAGSQGGAAALVAWTWDFGDGTGGSGEEVSHAFAAPGDRHVSLVVRDAAGREATDTVLVRLLATGSAPSAKLTADRTTVAPGTEVAFDSAGSKDPDGGTVLVAWDFGDPGSAGNVSSEPALRRAYAAEGSYLVTLTVTDDEGAATRATTTVVVSASGGGSGGGGGGGGCGSLRPLGAPPRGDASFALVLALLAGLVAWRAARAPQTARAGSVH